MSNVRYDLKNEEEAKEYIKNVGIEYQFECYSEKKPDGCHRLGDYMESIKSDFKEAAKIFKFTCDNHNYGKSCFKFGNYLWLGRGLKKDEDKASEYYEKGCKNDCKDSCYQLGVLLTSKDTKHPKDFVKGLKLFEKACNMNDASACHSASILHIKGAENVDVNFEKAFGYAQKACKLNYLYGCINLSVMYKKGSGVQQDDNLAKKYKEKALDMKRQLEEEQTQLKFGEARL